MGENTTTGFYSPDEGETGYHNQLLAGYQSHESSPHGGVPWVDFSQAPYSAPNDGVADATDEIVGAVTALKALGGGVLYGRKGDYSVKKNLLHLDDPAVVISVVGDGPYLTRFIFGDDLGSYGPLFSSAGRHGFPENPRYPGGVWRDFSIVNSGDTRTFTGDAIGGMWQNGYTIFTRILMENIVGSMFGFTAPYGVTILNCRGISCGDASNGSPAIWMEPNMEGGLLQGVPEECAIINTNVGIGSATIGNGPNYAHGIRLNRAWRTRLIGNTVTGAAVARSGIYGLDLESCIITENVVDLLGGGDDCIALHSTGLSARNIVSLNVCKNPGGNTPGSGYGVHEVKENAEQVHTDNLIANNVGTVLRD